MSASSLPRLAWVRHIMGMPVSVHVAVERAARSPAGLLDVGWCVNAGGDVLVHSPTGHPPWRIGVENPFDRTRIAA